ncbi:MAG TPA: hypothetical protein VKM54_25080 [Myxococcota bacterium]|nr:hypothetical protein [Myxococcota bacterium]
MKQPQVWLDEAKTAEIKNVFMAFHNPTFCRSGMGPIPEAQNPHKTIAADAKDPDIVVFNGHVHTTELYEVDGVKYLCCFVAGALNKIRSFPGGACIVARGLSRWH